jgi:hypothetical protein
VAVHDEATADDRLSVVDGDVLAALRAHDADVDATPARLVEEVDWRGRQIRPPVPPLHERCVDREQRSSFVRQTVFIEIPRGMLGIRSALEDPVFNEPVEAVGEDVPGESDPALVVLEAPGAVERLAEDHPHPSFANDARRSSDGAELIEQLLVLHARRIAA